MMSLPGPDLSRGTVCLRSFVILLAACLTGAVAAAAPFEVIHHFDNSTGYNPYYATPLVSGGKVYGMTQNGGAHSSGVLFRCNLDGSNHEVLKHFGASAGAADGSTPFGRVIEYSGKIYGMVRNGGTNQSGFGVIFRCDPDGANYEVVKHFGAPVNGRFDGVRPVASLVEHGGVLYGMTTEGGTNGLGVLFRCNADGSGYTVLKDFMGEDGNQPHGDVLIHGGRIYGTTELGGTNAFPGGVLFRCELDGANYEILKHFGGSAGAQPFGTPVVYNDQLYALTFSGGSAGRGVIFRCDLDGGNYTVLKNFDFGSGQGPFGSLLLYGAKLYGMTFDGGANGVGALFQCDLDGGNYTTLSAFGPTFATPDDGRFPRGSVSVSGGKLYGATSEGGTNLISGENKAGVLFRYTLSPSIVSFAPTSGATGAVVSIYGSGFTGATNVTLAGTNNLSFTVVSDTNVSTTIPALAYTGRIAIYAPSGASTSAVDFVVNHAPVVAQAIPNQSGTYGSAFTFTFDAGTFTDEDGQTLAYSSTGLPPGISFDGPSRTFSGTATLAGAYTVEVVANDQASPALTATNSFSITVDPAALTITADNKSKVYGDALPTLTASYSGFVNGDTAASLDTPVGLTTTATTASPVGTYRITASGAADINYTITHVSGTMTVTPAALRITADNKSRAYQQPNPTLTATYAGLVNGDTPASLDTPVALATTAVLSSLAGSYPITASGAADANYTITHVDGILTVSAAIAPSVAFPAATLAYTESSGAVLVDPTATVTDSDTPNFAGGTLTVDFASNGAAEDRLALLHQGTGPNEIGVSGQDVQYGGVTIGSLTGGTDGSTPLVVTLNAEATPDAVQALLRRLTYESASDLPSTATRTVRAVLDDGHGGVSLPATLAISIQSVPDDPIVSWPAPAPIVYGTALGAVQLNATASVPGTFAYTPAAGAVLHAGNGQVLSVTFTPDDTVNYNPATTNVALNVLPAPLSISADNNTKVYGAALPVLTASYAGFVNGDTPANLDIPVALATTVTAASSVGSYPITASGAADADYAITFVSGTLAVTPAAVTITADDKSKVYGDASPTLTASYAGFVNGDTAASLDTPVSLVTTATAASSVGTYPITTSGAVDANYTITFVAGTLTVTPASLTITADNKTKVYGAALPILTASYAGFVNGDTPASLDTPVSLTTTATQSSDVGSYVITASGAADLNYAITHINGALSVTPAALTITADDKSKVYGDALPTLTASYAGLVNGDTPASLDTQVSLTTTATAASSVGTYPITASGAADLNYTITHVNGTLTVTPAALTITADNKSKVYGAALPTLTVSYAGLVNGDTPASLDTQVTLATIATAASPVGTYPITASGAADLNYTITHVNGTLTVTRALLTISADDKSRPFLQENPPLTATYVGFVNGDAPASLTTPVQLTTTAILISLPGSYPITASGATAANYAITHVNGTLTVQSATDPVVTLPAGNLNCTENAGPVILDGSATVSDLDTPTFGGGSLIVDFKSNGTADDRLAIRNEGTGLNQIGVSGTNVTYSGLAIGSFTGGTDGNTPLVISLNDLVLPLVAQTLLRQVTFENVSDLPSTLTRTVRVVLDDGHGGTSAPATMTVSVAAVPDNPTITWATPAPIVYGTPLSGVQFNATASVPGSFAYTSVIGTVLHAAFGQLLSVSFTPDDTVNYNSTTATVLLDVLRAPLTITADNKAKVYGDALPILTASHAGFVNGDTAAGLDTPVTLATTATAASSVGNYPITASGASDVDYAITFVAGNLGITPATLTISAENKSKVYGAALPELTATYSGFVNGDTVASLDTPVNLATTATAASAVGTYPITASGVADANYTITFVAGTLTVLPAALTITADNKNKVYGDALPTLTASYAGFVNEDTAANLDTPVSLTTTATAGSSVGTYPITASGAADANYTITFVAGTLTVTPATLTITADNKSKLYGAALPELTASYAGLANGDAPASLDTPPSVATTATAASAAGSYSITVTGASDLNYTISFVDGTLTVAPATLTVTADIKSKLYGAALPPLTASYAGFVNGDTPASLDVPVALATTATAASSVGTYPITATGAADANYTIAFVSGTLTVTPASLTITADDKSKVYGASLPTLTVSYAGFVNSDTPASLDAPVVLTTAPAASSVGTYPIVASGAADANYTITFVAGTLTVTPAALTITADNKSKTYGAALPSLTANYAGFVNGDTPASLDTPATLATAATAASTAGSYPITVSGASDVNYTISHVNGTLTILPASLTVSADSKSMIYGGVVPTLTATYSGLVNGDTPASLTTPASLVTLATSVSDVGAYLIVVSGVTSPNYTVTHINGVLTIGKAPLAITAEDKTKAYGQALPGFTATYAGFVNGDTPASLDAAVTFGTPATAASNAGTYPIVPGGATDANYAITFIPGTLTITAVPLTITAESKSKVYGAALPLFTFTYAGLVNGDSPASLDTPPTGTTTATAASHVGSYPITASGAADVNYTIAHVGGTLTITPAPLTITADDQAKVYLGAVPILTASYSGFVNGDTAANLDTPVSLNTTAIQTSPVGTYPITAAGAANADYTITLVNGTLTVTDLPPQIVILSVSPAGDVTLQVTCQPGLTLDLEQSTDLVTWTSLVQLTLPTGADNHVDIGGGIELKKFYRLKIVP
jgi:uncharacterized repeat protein (TIGR03803 family)